ncbi:YgcG family protein [Pusillimonas sp. NJUB218]|uniref:TPM domain-containing protein n=1 Tax=Pusillimonas sp. NJUB218 TaxID=2023230 RepID=UPI001F28B30B|nr:YgcG family protein [Pusillimonas sp. NJUB218]
MMAQVNRPGGSGGFGLSRWLIWFGAFILTVVLGFLASPALAQDAAVPPLQARVTDTTGTLDAATVQDIEARLAALEQRKGAQIAVLMVPTTGTDSIEQYALRAFEQWQLGRKSVDDGILFVVAKDDRAMRIEVGYGLEGAVPDLLAGRIIREQVVPRFQAGDFAGGVSAGVDSLILLVDGEDLPPPETSAASADEESAELWGALLLLFFFFAALPWVAAPFTGIVLYVAWGNIFIALGGAVVAFFVSRALRAWIDKKGGGKGGPGGGGMRRRAGRIGAAGGFGAGGFGGGFGGGGFGGGGGSSGGGGASGRW